MADGVDSHRIGRPSAESWVAQPMTRYRLAGGVGWWSVVRTSVCESVKVEAAGCWLPRPTPGTHEMPTRSPRSRDRTGLIRHGHSGIEEKRRTSPCQDNS